MDEEREGLLSFEPRLARKSNTRYADRWDAVDLSIWRYVHFVRLNTRLHAY